MSKEHRNIVPINPAAAAEVRDPDEGEVMTPLTEDRIWTYGHKTLEELTALSGEMWRLTKQKTAALAADEAAPVIKPQQNKPPIWRRDLLAWAKRKKAKVSTAGQSRAADNRQQDQSTADFENGAEKLHIMRAAAQSRLKDLRECQILLGEIIPRLEDVVERFKQERVPSHLEPAFQERLQELKAAKVLAGQKQAVLTEACHSEIANLRGVSAEETALLARTTAAAAQNMVKNGNESAIAHDPPEDSEVLPPATKRSKRTSSVIAFFKGLGRDAFAPPYRIGQMVKGKGIYVGVQEITTKGGLKKVFDLYAAPEDLTDGNDKKLVTTYNNAVKALNEKKGWYGYDGECFENHKKLEAALADDTYQGGWFIPTLKVLEENLYKNKDKGDLKGTFTDKRDLGDAHWYWSCTEPPANSSSVYDVSFTFGNVTWLYRDTCKLSTRPVRAELRPS